jgi:Holliday junction resolvase RusA-like endonuclease
MRGDEKGPFGIIEIAANFRKSEDTEIPLLKQNLIVLDLPAPPSINRAGAQWRLGNKASKVMRWRRAADAHLIYTRQHTLLRQPIVGYFACDVLWDRRLADELHSDIDNRIKYLLDYLEHLRLFENDQNCRSLTVNYGNIPDGCRVRLRAYDWQSQRE